MDKDQLRAVLRAAFTGVLPPGGEEAAREMFDLARRTIPGGSRAFADIVVEISKEVAANPLRAYTDAFKATRGGAVVGLLRAAPGAAPLREAAEASIPESAIGQAFGLAGRMGPEFSLVGDIAALTEDAPRDFGEGRNIMGAVDVLSAVPLLGMALDPIRAGRVSGRTFQEAPSLIQRIKNNSESGFLQREDFENLLTTDTDSPARIADDLGQDVSQKDVDDAREWLIQDNASIRERLPENLTVFRSADGLDNEFVEVTTRRDVAQFFADQRGTGVVEFQIPRDAVELDLHGVTGGATAFDEDGLLIRGSSIPPETVGGPAMKIGDDIIEGSNHGDVYNRLNAEQKAAVDAMSGNEYLAAEGFNTSRGRFVGREEATRIAEQAGQVPKGVSPGGLVSEQLPPAPLPTAALLDFAGEEARRQNLRNEGPPNPLLALGGLFAGQAARQGLGGLFGDPRRER